MRALHRFFTRVWNFSALRWGDKRLREEMQSHLAAQTEDNIRAGMAPEEARRQARLKFGGAEAIREQYHAEEGLPFLEHLIQDVRYSLRQLRKSPGFTLTAVLTLALGIGANTAMFSVIHSVLLKPWPFPHSGRLIWVHQRQTNGGSNLFSTRDFLNWKQQGGLLAHMGAHVSWQFNLSTPGTQPERVSGGKISSDLLPVLDVQPTLGQIFSAKQDLPGSGNFVILSNALWKERYNADSRIIDKTIQLDGAPYTVVAVMPAGFNGFSGKELLWTPLQLSRNNAMGSSPNLHWLAGCIRLPDDISLKQARSELDAVAARLHRRDPSANIGFGVSLQTLNDAFTADVRPALLMLMGCVGFVLLIACANIANLLLARGASRTREMAVRAALGASRMRIVRQLLTESTLLAIVGGAAGAGTAFLLLRGILAVHPPDPRITQTDIDATVLVFALVVSIIVGFLFGLVPAINASRMDPNAGLRERGGGTGHATTRQRSILVIAETALACMLLIGTGLALKSLWSLRNVKLGFVPQNVLTFRIAAPSQLKGARISDFYYQIAARVRAVPGVQSVAVARDLPLSGTDPSMPIQTKGRTAAPGQDEIVTRYRAVGIDYFRTLKVPLLRGRPFNEHDTADSPDVAIVSESLAREYWPGENPIGKQIKPKFSGSSWCTVIGVAADVHHWGQGVAIEPTAYYPFTQIPDSIRPLIEGNMSFAVRSGLAQNDLLQSIKHTVAEVNSNIPIYGVQSMDSMLADTGSLRNFDLTLLGAFSVLALSLALVGVYAVMAYSVSQRTQEIGVRIALGAGQSSILRLILRQGALLAMTGAAIGVVGAVFLRKFMAGFIYGLSRTDPVVLIIVPCLMVLTVLMACWIPAIRAASIDPMQALRSE